MRKRTIVVLALAVFAVAPTFGQAKQILTFVLTLEAKSLDPTVTAETAADFVYTFLRLMNPASGAEYAALATTYI